MKITKGLRDKVKLLQDSLRGTDASLQAALDADDLVGVGHVLVYGVGLDGIAELIDNATFALDKLI